MKRVVLVTLLALAMPLMASASNIAVTNSGGVLVGSANGLTLTNSTLIQYGAVVGPNLGTLSFSTGKLISGSLKMGGTFAAGGTFVIIGNGINGVPNGVIFNGTFSGPVTWTLITSGKDHSYKLSGAVVASNGTATMVQLTIDLHHHYFVNRAKISSGDTNLTVTPEIGTLGLFGTGLVGIAGLIRRRVSSH